MFTNLQLMQFGVPLAYKINNFSVAVTPLVQYGSLDINYNAGGGNTGYGTSQDFKWGYNLGTAYTTDGLTVGASYTSQIDMEYNGVMSTTVGPMTRNVYTNNKLSTPATIGVGASYKLGGSTLALDYKQIQWSKADGYKDFKWKDQNVIIVGYQYDTDNWALRLGYNYAKSPISEQAATYYNASTGLSGPVINTFNLLGFPAIVQSHVAVGGTYKFSKQTSLDLAYTYAPEVSNTYSGSSGGMGTQTISTKHSQTGVSAQLNYKF